TGAPCTDRRPTSRRSTSSVGPTRSTPMSSSRQDAPGASTCCAAPSRPVGSPKIGRPAYCHAAPRSARWASARPLPHRATCVDRGAFRDRGAPPEVDLALGVELRPLPAQEPRVRLLGTLDQIPLAKAAPLLERSYAVDRSARDPSRGQTCGPVPASPVRSGTR